MLALGFGLIQAGLQLLVRFAAVQVGAAGFGFAVGADEHALPCAQCAPGVGAQFEALASGLTSAFASGVDEVAEVELGFGVFGAEFGAFFLGGVVKQEFVVAAAFVGFGFDAGEGFVVGQAAGVAEAGWGVGAVVEAAGDDGAVDVAFDEVDQDFLANSGQEQFAVVLPGQAAGDAYPAAAHVVMGGAAAGGVAVVVLGALPVELDFDAA